jgi:hypothetical protein
MTPLLSPGSRPPPIARTVAMAPQGRTRCTPVRNSKGSHPGLPTAVTRAPALGRHIPVHEPSCPHHQVGARGLVPVEVCHGGVCQQRRSDTAGTFSRRGAEAQGRRNVVPVAAVVVSPAFIPSGLRGLARISFKHVSVSREAARTRRVRGQWCRSGVNGRRT